MRSPTDWISILTRCGVKASTAVKWADAFANEVQDDEFSLGAAEVPVFVGQILHESALLERLEENLNYTRAGRLCEIWPSRFKTVDDAEKFVRNPIALANKVYGGRLGNVDAGDGWRYRGSGPIQVTGKDNFVALERITGLPLVANPDLLRRPGAEALRVCVAWWEGHVPDAVMGNAKRVRRAVNGGEIGLDETVRLARIASEVLA